MDISSYPTRLPENNTFRLLKLPMEIFIMITSQLDKVSFTTLSLTGKAACAVFNPTKLFHLSYEERQIFLPLLEKDPRVGDHLWFCHFCSALHGFKKWQGLHMMLEDLETWRYLTCPIIMKHKKVDRLQWYRPPQSNLILGYHHARLFMNHHLYGPTCGLPVRGFALSRRFGMDGTLNVEQSVRARIIDDRLIMRCTHTITPVESHSSAEHFRKALNSCRLSICNHVSINKPYEYRDPYPKLRPLEEIKTWGADGVFQAHREASNSCGSCPTDFETTIETKQDFSGSANSRWCITITSYHLLGGCRTPSDAEHLGAWRSELRQCCGRDCFHFPKEPGDERSEWHYDLMPTPFFEQRRLGDARDLLRHPACSIRQRWIESDR